MIEVVAALIRSGDRFMICQRGAQKSRALLWEFPGGKVEPGETKAQALARECREELAVELQVGEAFMDVTHVYPDVSIHLTLLEARIVGGEATCIEHNDIRLITPQEIDEYAFCPADQVFLPKLRGEAPHSDQQTIGEENTMDHVKRAGELFREGYSCSQAVAGAFCEEMGLSLEQAARMASSFGGGMGGQRETCGAVTGMFLVVGMLRGYGVPGNQAEKTAHYARVRAMADAFKAKHDTCVCRDLLAGLPGKLAKDPLPRTEAYYKVRPCVLFVETAAQILEDVLREEA